MNVTSKSDLIKRISSKSGLAQSEVKQTLDILVDSIHEALKHGGSVRLPGFGIFSVQSYEGRAGMNPRTKEKIQLPPYKRPLFKAGKELKDTVNNRSVLG